MSKETEPTIFDFGVTIARPDENGIYHDAFYCNGEGVNEVEALRQWMVAEIFLYLPHEKAKDFNSKLERLCYLADKKTLSEVY
jgi:hypothetical protein